MLNHPSLGDFVFSFEFDVILATTALGWFPTFRFSSFFSLSVMMNFIRKKPIQRIGWLLSIKALYQNTRKQPSKFNKIKTIYVANAIEGDKSNPLLCQGVGNARDHLPTKKLKLISGRPEQVYEAMSTISTLSIKLANVPKKHQETPHLKWDHTKEKNSQ